MLVVLGLIGAIPGLAGFAVWLGKVLHADPGAQPAPVREGEALGAAKTTEQSMEVLNEQLRQTAASAGAADVQRVRDDHDANAVVADPGAAVNRLPGELFRD